MTAASNSPTGADDYVLRPRDDTEITRLYRQHRVWQRETQDLISLASFGRGDRLLDVGCGPGALSLDLAEIVGPTGRVTGLDQSPRFLEYLRESAAKAGRPNIETVLGDAVDVDLPSDHYDGAVVRWLLMFVPDVPRLLRRIFDLLRPGGTLAVMEYLDPTLIRLWPPSRAFTQVFQAVGAHLERSGAEPDIGWRVPGVAQETGFEIETTRAHLPMGGPGSSWWKWVEEMAPNHQLLVDRGVLTGRILDEYQNDWNDRSTNPHALVFAPPLLHTIARKPVRDRRL